MKEEAQRQPAPELNIIPATPDIPDKTPGYVPGLNDGPLERIQDETDQDNRDDKRRGNITEKIIKKRKGRYAPVKMPDPKTRH